LLRLGRPEVEKIKLEKEMKRKRGKALGIRRGLGGVGAKRLIKGGGVGMNRWRA